MAQFESRFQKGPGCWLWEGQVQNSGYGVYNKQLAHRASYEFYIGPIPPGLHIDHLCKVRLCVRPSHLEPVTQAENNRRSPKQGTTVCPQGHHKQPGRHCVRCKRKQGAAYKARCRQKAKVVSIDIGRWAARVDV